MRKTTAIGVALALLAAPAAADAKPDRDDSRSNAAQECRSERGDSAATREAFAVKYGTNANRRNAFGKCVSRRTVDEQRETERAHSNASKTCKAEAAQIGAEAFAEKYGTGKKGRNAHGKCVSTTAKALEREADAQDREQIADRKNAAKMCAAERAADPNAFTAKYGANKRKRNAFGKCVSATAKALRHERKAAA